MSHTRSGHKNSTLPPVFATNSTNRIKALEDVYGKTKSLMNEKTVKRAAVLSSMQSSGSKLGNNTLKEVVYGRDVRMEKIDDLRQEINEARKLNAELTLQNRQLTTKMNRLKREGENREKYLQSIVANKFQPAEVKHTHLAKTLTSIQVGRIENEQLIQLHAEENERLRALLSSNRTSEEDNKTEGKKRNLSSNPEQQNSEDDDNDNLLNGNVTEASKKVRDKRRLEVARAHIRQNMQLREKLLEAQVELADLRKQLSERTRPLECSDIEEMVDRIKNTRLLNRAPKRTQKTEESEEKHHNSGEREPRTLENPIRAVIREKEDSQRIEQLRSEDDSQKEASLKSESSESSEVLPVQDNYRGLFYGASFEDTDISPSESSMHAQHVPPLDIRAMSASTSPEQRSVNSHLTERQAIQEDYAEQQIVKDLLGDLTIAHLHRKTQEQIVG